MNGRATHIIAVAALIACPILAACSPALAQAPTADQPIGLPRISEYEPISELRDIHFDFDSAAIRPAERSKIQEAANYLRSNPGAQLALEGHCDWRGTTEYNLGLGDRRARSVRDFLASLGVDASRVQTVSKGDLEAAEGATEAQAQQDRRVDFVLVGR